jgi:hypothetical protein
MLHTLILIEEFTFATDTQAHRGDLYINNISNNRRQQFPRSVILLPNDDHIGRNCSDEPFK